MSVEYEWVLLQDLPGIPKGTVGRGTTANLYEFFGGDNLIYIYFYEHQMLKFPDWFERRVKEEKPK